MRCLVRIVFAIFACSVAAMGYAYEYSQQTIDSYISSCKAGNMFTQARCECAIKEIQQSISEEDYKASVKDPAQVKPEVLAVYGRAIASCADADK